MILKKITIHKYKSFLTEQTLDVEEQITRIVGKNESGKSALLEALAKTNYFENNPDYKFSMELDFPRKELIRSRGEKQKAITCVYELSDRDISNIEELFLPKIISSRCFFETTYYDNCKEAGGIAVDFSVFKTWLIQRFQLGDDAKNIINNETSFIELKEAVINNIELTGMKPVGEKLGEIYNTSKTWDDQLAEYFFVTFVKPNIPKCWYFSDYFSLPCRIKLKDLATEQQRGNMTPEEYKIAKALFELSGLKLKDISDESNFETFKALLEATSNSITDEMFQYWSTNQNLEIRFEVEHNNGERFLNIRVYNSKHRVTLPLKNRSKGFLWFFSFLVWFSKIQGDKTSKYILLLDEPGLSLHASAQNDLLRFIDQKLAPEYQVIYTTHSPFMIDSLKLNEVRTVYDTQNPNVGSVASDALEEKDSDTLFPLQAALGYTIAQNLYVSKKNLLVEGISDLVYLNYFSSILKSMEREGLCEDITIVPVGGADKIATFISLMRGNELSTVCLLDTFTDQSAKSRLKRMVEHRIITDQKIIFYHTVLNQSFADIEDMFKKEEYILLYNGAFGDSIKTGDIDDGKPIMSQLKRLNGNRSFNHFLPANYMAKHIDTVLFCEETIAHFEELFRLINSKF